MIAATPLSILAQAALWLAQGQPVALVTLVGIEGSASRGLGSLMAVARDGAFCGSLSGGCLDDAILSEARLALAAGVGHVRRYGLGSPYIDIRLPCGGGMDLLFTPLREAAPLEEILRDLQARRPVALRLSPQGLAPRDAAGGAQATGWHADVFTVALQPALRLLLFGQGEELQALARLGAGFGATIAAFSPRAQDGRALAAAGLACQRLETLDGFPAIAGDGWSAVIFLFHERDWEEALLPPALALPAFYHGAVGSPRTHANRLAWLAARGVPADRIARLQGSIGLIPSTRDPASLALSILAQVVDSYGAIGRGATEAPAARTLLPARAGHLA